MSAGKVAAGELRANPGICGGLCKCDVQAGRERDVGGHGANSRKVLYTATSYRKYIRALTFENLCQLGFVPLMSNVKTQTVLEPPLVGAEYARKLPAVIYSHGMLANRSCYSTPCINFFFSLSAFFLLHTLHPLFFAPHALCKHVCYHVYVHIHAYFFLYILYILFLYILFFCPRCAVQVCMLSCICTHTCIFLHIYIHIHSYIGPATRPRASTWPPTASSSLRFTHTHTHTHMRTRHGDVGIKVCMYMYVHCT